MSEQILNDARSKHNLSFGTVHEDQLIALINYVRHIGYNDGFLDGKEEMSQQIARMMSSR